MTPEIFVYLFFKFNYKINFMIDFCVYLKIAFRVEIILKTSTKILIRKS